MMKRLKASVTVSGWQRVVPSPCRLNSAAIVLTEGMRTDGFAASNTARSFLGPQW